jgi:uncharacterized membrane protein
MGYGLLGIGQQQADQAIAGLGEVARMENARNEQSKSLKTQQEVASQQMKGTLAATGGMAGAMYGMQAGSIGGPMGMAIGAVGGLILGSLF